MGRRSSGDAGPGHEQSDLRSVVGPRLGVSGAEHEGPQEQRRAGHDLPSRSRRINART